MMYVYIAVKMIVYNYHTSCTSISHAVVYEEHYEARYSTRKYVSWLKWHHNDYNEASKSQSRLGANNSIVLIFVIS